jgi:hypothetical protein
LNLKAKVIVLPFFNSNIEESHCSNTNFIINSGLLLLSTKKGSDKFNVASDQDLEEANNGINKYILFSPICLIKDAISIKLPSI